MELTDLPYPASALQPHLSERAVALQHDQHQRACVEIVQARTAGTEWEDAALERIVHESQGTLFEAAAQAWNQQFQWQCLRTRGGGEPQGRLAERVKRHFGDTARLRQAFNEAALGLFGAGWAWLVQHPDGSLAIQVTRNAGTPLTGLSTPLLGCNLWEHAYYLDYQNDRARYLDAWWQMVDWEFAAAQLAL
ncbi:Fe-Mn family superoxide dismutase [Stenotrophomonas tumulicola]